MCRSVVAMYCGKGFNLWGISVCATLLMSHNYLWHRLFQITHSGNGKTDYQHIPSAEASKWKASDLCKFSKCTFQSRAPSKSNMSRGQMKTPPQLCSSARLVRTKAKHIDSSLKACLILHVVKKNYSTKSLNPWLISKCSVPSLGLFRGYCISSVKMILLNKIVTFDYSIKHHTRCEKSTYESTCLLHFHITCPRPYGEYWLVIMVPCLRTARRAAGRRTPLLVVATQMVDTPNAEWFPAQLNIFSVNSMRYVKHYFSFYLQLSLRVGRSMLISTSTQ